MKLVDAVFFVEPADDRLTVVLESRGPQRNPDYSHALDLILSRLARLDTRLIDAWVDSRVTRQLAPEARRVIEGPLRLDPSLDAARLRTRLTTAAARVGRRPNASGPGNPTKRLRLAVEVPGFGSSDADRLEETLARPTGVSKLFEVDAADLLRDFIGVELTTVRGQVNRILGVRPPIALVATGRSPEGAAVQVADVAGALETLNEEGSVELSTEAVGYRSGFIGALLRELPDTRIEHSSPPRIVYDPRHRHATDPTSDETSRTPAPGPFQGDLDRPITARQRREQRKLRRALLAGRDEAPCAVCGDIFPARFLWASHIKRRSVATEDEVRDLPYIAMLACILGCDALFEDGYIAVRDGTFVGTTAVDVGSALGQRVRALEGRPVDDYARRAPYFSWHHEQVFRP
ncbi:hypothetical protein GC089_14725 [Cellulomonas sp. JZ18]|uniref:hypothetical protein n=1 Tax=Cellulomonas sp. JZ18 TaxID=2654191 RepID=UPI0012D4A74E|nr:hypothetical protein [Cellulomonas sp. JZ18]QGQ20225.1 hypothetical protein GC089_14725 [Cellulomonas sp. JZ18]